ncbi:transport protein Avl9-domain-containing protein [Cladochytrium replicatum]|nr:transport protein Avl9-domain-containing protein [Cladochytrium replicatum]
MSEAEIGEFVQPTARSDSSPGDSEGLIYQVLCVGFHHRNGPQAEIIFGPGDFFGVDENGIELPEEWSILPFLCLPDGAHASEEEFIFFHLPPLRSWKSLPERTSIFGMACFRQLPATELLHRTADVTRSTVQKAVVVLAREPILGSLRTKLGIVTQAFFAQRDFSKYDILQNFYDSLNGTVRRPISDATLYMGISLREIVHRFKQKTLVLFFGQKVERLCAYQYGLVSLIPDLLRSLTDVGSPALSSTESLKVNPQEANPNPFRASLQTVFDTPHLTSPYSPTTASLHFADLLPEAVSKSSQLSSSKQSLPQHPRQSRGSTRSLEARSRNARFGLPLRVFGEGCFFQPYIPLQQIDVLMSPQTRSFVVGTSNAIFMHNRSCAIEAIVNADQGTVEILDPTLNAALSLGAADRRFIDEICKSVATTWNDEEQIRFDGSDDDIRMRFESYLHTLISSVKATLIPVTVMQASASPVPNEGASSSRPVTPSTLNVSGSAPISPDGTHDSSHPLVNPSPQPVVVSHLNKDYLSDFGNPFVKLWMGTKNYEILSEHVFVRKPAFTAEENGGSEVGGEWESIDESDVCLIVPPGHLFAGSSALTTMQINFARGLSEMAPAFALARQNMSKAFTTAESSLSKAVKDISASPVVDAAAKSVDAAAKTAAPAAATAAATAAQVVTSASTWFANMRRDFGTWTTAAAQPPKTEATSTEKIGDEEPEGKQATEKDYHAHIDGETAYEKQCEHEAPNKSTSKAAAAEPAKEEQDDQHGQEKPGKEADEKEGDVVVSQS